jgi:hypothetical protein
MGDPQRIEKERPALAQRRTAMMPQTRQNAITDYPKRLDRWSAKTYAIGQAL